MFEHTILSPPHEPVSSDGVLEPLADTYRELGLEPPSGRVVPPAALPHDCRRLLVHRTGMTRTLEMAYGQSLRLEVLRRTFRPPVLTRQVVLCLPHDGAAVELALIRIHLNNLPEAAQQRILAEELPLGTILRLHRIAYDYHPRLYFAAAAGGVLPGRAADPAARASVCYGRRVLLLGAHGRPVADAIEIPCPVA